jgi:DNA polymerase-3 subunit epsilon
MPSVDVVALSDYRFPRVIESFGIFPSERKARNALVRLAIRHCLCHCLLGICGAAKVGCPACPVDQPGSACVDKISRKKQLVRIFAALKPLEVQVWPHRGPIGIRERSDIHVVDHWQFLGTAQSENELHGLLESTPREFDRRLYLLLKRTLSRLPQRKLVDLSLYGQGTECSAAVPSDIHN